MYSTPTCGQISRGTASAQPGPLCTQASSAEVKGFAAGGGGLGRSARGRGLGAGPDPPGRMRVPRASASRAAGAAGGGPPAGCAHRAPRPAGGAPPGCPGGRAARSRHQGPPPSRTGSRKAAGGSGAALQAADSGGHLLPLTRNTGTSWTPSWSPTLTSWAGPELEEPCRCSSSQAAPKTVMLATTVKAYLAGAGPQAGAPRRDAPGRGLPAAMRTTQHREAATKSENQSA